MVSSKKKHIKNQLSKKKNIKKIKKYVREFQNRFYQIDKFNYAKDNFLIFPKGISKIRKEVIKDRRSKRTSKIKKDGKKCYANSSIQSLKREKK
ncbi:unnamed protein product [Paramecium sonneborni]|uniref:Uncharacterized protein n=1 Tax=Paramecium sonneborni TaxID=65129 RepID=A0A8S1M295_9CILI|nr:unnamed protein product [Paramecium sonneborni]